MLRLHSPDQTDILRENYPPNRHFSGNLSLLRTSSLDIIPYMGINFNRFFVVITQNFILFLMSILCNIYKNIVFYWHFNEIKLIF